MRVLRKLHLIQKAVNGGLDKSKGSQLGYNYHGIEGLMDTLRPLFLQHELLMVPSFRKDEHPPGRVAGTVSVTIYDVEEYDNDSDPMGADVFYAECYVDVSNSGRSDGKGAGIAMSYGIKNILLKTNQIGDGKEDPESLDVSAKDMTKDLNALRDSAQAKFGKGANARLNKQMRVAFKKKTSKDLNYDEVVELQKWVDAQVVEED